MTMTPEIARDRFWEDFREVEQLVEPAVPFELRTMSQPEGRSRCDVPNGPLGGGHLYFIHAHESSAPIDDPVAKAELVIEHWNAKGYEMQMFGADGEDLFRQVIALTHEGNVLNFTVGPTGMGLGGETACVPTDD